jgi:hypothetical protein
MTSRRLVLALPLGLPLGLLACAGRDPEIPLPNRPIGVVGLPLRLNVAEIVLPPPAPPPTDLGARTSLAPAAAVRLMAERRLGALGPSGRAVFSITQASLPGQDRLVACLLGCRLDILNGEGASQGYMEAQSQASISLPSGVRPETRQRAAEAMLRQALDKLNVEFEFQLRRTLRSWLVETAGGATPPVPRGGVQREDLPRG